MPGRTLKKDGRGRPPHQPTKETREAVTRLAGLLVTHRSIARDWLKIDERTLLKYYQNELDNGQEIVIGELKAKAHHHAMNGSLRAIFGLLDHLPGAWPVPETAPGGQPPTIVVRVHGGTGSIEALQSTPDAETT